MKKLSIIFLSLTISLAAISQTASGILRYYLHRQATYDVVLDRLKRITYLGDSLTLIRYTDNTRHTILNHRIDSIVYIANSSVPNSPSNRAVNRNRNTDPQASQLEFPHRKEGEMNLLIKHSTPEYGNTYSLEWDCSKKANRWTCYQMYDGNTCDNEKRNNTFREDEDIPTAYRTVLSQYVGSGFSRGHLCPAADRRCSKVQNQQTFYLSNMQPQYQRHNAGVWKRLETQVRAWNNTAFRDTLFVVKAATIDRDDQISGTTRSGLLIPKYFYMAILCKKDGHYQAIGLWTLHDEKKHSGDFSQYAISIDELERRIGIDFFCNLPDDIEDEIESRLNIDAWRIKTPHQSVRHIKNHRSQNN